MNTRLASKKTPRSAFIILAALAALAFSLPPSVRAEDFFSLADALSQALPGKDSKYYGDWVERFRLANRLLGDRKKDLNQLDLSLAAGFSGDRAGEQSLYKLNVEAAVNKGVYPRTVRFRAGTSVQHKNNVAQDNVTTLVMNFDYYFAPWFETYAFIERFSDTYLSIKERYEVGGGIKLELNLLDTPVGERTRQDREAMAADGASSLQEFAAFLDRAEQEGDGQVDARGLRPLLAAYRTERRNILAGLRQKESMLSLGLALSFFSEMEQAEINATILSQGVSESARFALDAEQRFRVVVRPNVTFRPLDTLSFKGYIYLKYPLGGPLRSEGRLDYRTDSFLSAELKLPTDPEWGKRVSLILEYQRHYENLPPRIPQSTIDATLAAGQSISPVEAERTHDLYVFKVSVTF